MVSPLSALTLSRAACGGHRPEFVGDRLAHDDIGREAILGIGNRDKLLVARGCRDLNAAGDQRKIGALAEHSRNDTGPGDIDDLGVDPLFAKQPRSTAM